MTDAEEPAIVELREWIEQAKEVIFYARVAARSKGYALATHGTLRRDLDVVAAPWTDAACDADELAQHITESLGHCDASYEGAWESAAKTREVRPFGRVAWSIPLKWKFHTGAGPYLDLSVCSRSTVVPLQPSETPPQDETELGRERYYCGCIRLARWERCERHAALDHDEEPPVRRRADVTAPGQPSETPSAQRVAYLEAALRKIAERRGRFSRDQLTFASNTVDDIAEVATKALDGTWELPEDAASPPVTAGEKP